MEDAVDAEYESGKTSERVTRAMAANAAAGRAARPGAWAYRREYTLTPAGKRVLLGQVPDPVTAPVVARIFDEIGRGISLRACPPGWTRRGHPAPAAAGGAPRRCGTWR